MNTYHKKHGFIFILFFLCATGILWAQYPSPAENHAFAITQQPLDIQACPGETVRFSVGITGSDLHYQWKRGDVNLIDGPKISGSNSPQLTIYAVDPSDAAADYHCLISNDNGQILATHHASLFQNIPVITFEPDDIWASEGEAASLTVTAAGNNLSYQWMKGPMSLVDGEFISGATSPVLTLKTVSAQDIGNDYYVVVYSGCPLTDTSAMVSLNADPSVAFLYTDNQQVFITEINAEETVQVPGGFSPNGDGINDIFVVDRIETFPNNRFIIYDQEGKKVFEMEGYQNTWNGKLPGELSGSDLPEGTYFYVLELDDSRMPLKGSIYLRK
jgi:gliding motility-associated-like protein